MKKILVIITIASILALMLSSFVFAADNTDVPQWFTDMMSWKKAQIDQAVKDNTITEDQAALYRDRIDQMEKFHTENGFPQGMGFGACHGGSGAGNGFGPGMMGNYSTR